MKITKRQLRQIIKEEKQKLLKEMTAPPAALLTQLELAMFKVVDWYKQHADPRGDLTSGDLETEIGMLLNKEVSLFIQENLPESEEW